MNCYAHFFLDKAPVKCNYDTEILLCLEVKRMNGSLEGKTLIFLGSSVTFGSASGGVSFADFIGRRNGCNIIKEAVSGTTLTDDEKDSYIARLKKTDCEKADIFICQLSTNDASKRKTQGAVSEKTDTASFDTKTVAGAIEYIICYARNRWKCPVVFYTSPKYDNEDYSAMVALLGRIKEKYRIAVIDMWNDEEFNRELDIKRSLYMKDRIHPTAEGYLEQWTPYFEKALRSILTQSSEY